MRPSPASRALSARATAAVVAALVAGCGSAHKVRPAHAPAPALPPIVGTPAARPVSSEALAGHPTKPQPAPRGCPRRASEKLITRPTWLSQVEITEYFQTPESWFSGARVHAPGLPGLHRVDWLYSASGITMEGEGIGVDGHYYGLESGGSGGWVNASGRLTVPSACASHWSAGAPLWLAGGWRNSAGQVTFPLERGGWSNGVGVRTVSYQGVTFAPRPPPSLRPYYSVAVDPALIPRGSRIYIPAYRPVNGGWFVAQDTGGAIIGHHIDVYRPPTESLHDGGRYLTGERVYVVPPGS